MYKYYYLNINNMDWAELNAKDKFAYIFSDKWTGKSPFFLASTTLLHKTSKEKTSLRGALSQNIFSFFEAPT